MAKRDDELQGLQNAYSELHSFTKKRSKIDPEANQVDLFEENRRMIHPKRIAKSQKEDLSSYQFKLFHPDIKNTDILQAELIKRKEEKDKLQQMKREQKQFFKLQQLLKFNSVETLQARYPQHTELLQKIVRLREIEIAKSKFQPKPEKNSYARPTNERERQPINHQLHGSKSVSAAKEEPGLPLVTWEGLEKISYQDLRKEFKNRELQDFIAKSTDVEDDVYLADYQLSEEDKAYYKKKTSQGGSRNAKRQKSEPKSGQLKAIVSDQSKLTKIQEYGILEAQNHLYSSMVREQRSLSYNGSSANHQQQKPINYSPQRQQHNIIVNADPNAQQQAHYNPQPIQNQPIYIQNQRNAGEIFFQQQRPTQQVYTNNVPYLNQLNSNHVSNPRYVPSQKPAFSTPQRNPKLNTNNYNYSSQELFEKSPPKRTENQDGQNKRFIQVQQMLDSRDKQHLDHIMSIQDRKIRRLQGR